VKRFPPPKRKTPLAEVWPCYHVKFILSSYLTFVVCAPRLIKENDFFEGDSVELFISIVAALIGATIIVAGLDLLFHEEPRQISIAVIVWSNWFFAILNTVVLIVFWKELTFDVLSIGVFVVLCFALSGFFVRKKYQKPQLPSSRK